MKKIIKSADLLIQPFEFNIKEQQGASSILGGFTTILIMIFTIFYFLGALIKNSNSLNDIYAGSQSEQNTNQVKQLENTLVAIEFSTDLGKILSNITEISQYFNITGQFVQQQRIEEVQGYTRNYTSLNKVKCDQNRVEQFNFDPQAMTNKQQENLLCFDGYFNLQGQFYDSYFSYFRIMIQVCDNSTTHTCKSLEEISNLINQGIKIDLFVQGSRIRSKFNESSPAVQYSSNIYWKLNNQMADNEDIYIETIALDLKKSQFLNELFGIESYERIYSGQGIQKQERRQESTTVTNNAVLASFYLRESTDFQYYFVLQQDYSALVFQAISQAAGLCLAVLEIARVIYKGYNQHHIFETIMNSVYQFDLKSKGNQRQSVIDDKNLNKQLDDVLHCQISYTFFQHIYYETKRFFKKLNIFPSLNKQVTTDKERELIISSIAKKKIESDLDLTNILKKLYEIDCLKLLLLDDNQLMLFNSICKPIFTNKTEELLEDNEKMIKEVEQYPLKELGKTPAQNLEETDINNNIQQAAQSKLPLDIRLAKLAWFFKSQLKLPNKLLIHNYRVIKKNGLVGLNKKLLQFTQQNNGLYTLLNKIATKTQQEEEARVFQDIPNLQNKENQNNDQDHHIDMNDDIQSVNSDSNSNQEQNNLSQGDKQGNE